MMQVIYFMLIRGCNMKAKLVRLTYKWDGDSVLDLLIDYIYYYCDGIGYLQDLVEGFNDKHNVVDIIDYYYYNSSDYETDDSDVDDDYEWIKFSIYGKTYIISAFDDDFNGFKQVYSKSKDGYEIFYVYKKDVN